jgi:serpin B
MGWAGSPDRPVWGQTESKGRQVGNNKAELSAVVDGGDHFAFDLYGRLRAGQGNLFFSPASISTALAMTLAGAAGETATEMARTLHVQMPKEQLDEAMRDLLAAWKSNEKKAGYQLQMANRLWAQSGQQFLPGFLAVTRDDYGAELARLDFVTQAEQARQTINKWVEDQTANKITDLIPSAALLKAARLVLTNAVYFKGDWTDPFDKSRTKDEDFHVAADRTIKAPLMSTRHRLSYAAADGMQILELPYGDRSLSLIAILPEKPGGLADLEGKLTFDNWRQWTGLLQPQEVIVYLPRFKTTSQFELGRLLQSMGMVSAFVPHAADFSGMTGNRDLYISAVLHKAFVDVNEEGTEAAAATAVVMVRASARPLRPTKPPVFRADHPFVFAIRDNRNGAILFLGRVADPTQP